MTTPAEAPTTSPFAEAARRVAAGDDHHEQAADPAPLRLVVMGVSGAGKSTIASALARRLDASLLDADSLHPPGNVSKMAAGVPLTDDDRLPWLERVRRELSSHERLVVACSTLKRSYRNVIRAADDVRFAFLDLDPSTARRRSEQRHGHFMPADLVASQFETLERPGPDEADVITIDAHAEVDTIVERVISQL